MGRRSNFPRRKHDAYQTIEVRAVAPLIPHLREMGIWSYAEPCVGEGHLLCHLDGYGLECLYVGDILMGQDACLLSHALAECGADAVITNPPWTRALLHPMIWNLMMHADIVWLLFDAPWMFTAQARTLLAHCSRIVAIPRVKWIEGSEHNAKDDACWYCFQLDHTIGPHFYP